MPSRHRVHSCWRWRTLGSVAVVVVVVLLVMEALVVAFLVESEAVESVGAAEDVTEAAEDVTEAAKVVWD